ncbi:hypothetical protein Lser_V15G26248 [Lactuca serriola]
MVRRNLGTTTRMRRRKKVNYLISFLLVLIFSLMFDVFSGGDGRRTRYSFVEGAVGKSDGGSGAIFWITGGGIGSSGGFGSQSNVGIAIAMTVMVASPWPPPLFTLIVVFFLLFQGKNPDFTSPRCDCTKAIGLELAAIWEAICQAHESVV